MSDYVPEKYCCDCMFAEFCCENAPCKGCVDLMPHPRFEPALQEHDWIELAGAMHRVAKEGDWYWLHRDLPAHNLQLFFDAGMSLDQVHTFFLSVDKDIKPDGSWPHMSMLQLVRCIHAIRNDCRFKPVAHIAAPEFVVSEPVTVKDTRMSKIFKNAEELKGTELQHGDTVVFNTQHVTLRYEVRSMYLTSLDGRNGRVFEVLGMNTDAKNLFAEEAYGYSLPMRSGFWPCAERGDYAALTRLCLALYEKIGPTPVVLKSAADVLKYGLKNGTRILFPGTSTEYKVESRPEVFGVGDGLYLDVPGCRANDYIFDELKLDKEQFCTLMYGYEPKSGDWPEADGEDYAALTRAVVCLMHLAEARSQTRETDKVKNLRAKLDELVVQRESYEEDVQAAKQAVQEATEALDQARSYLSYEEGELETLQEDIDELVEAIEEALEGK